MMMMINVYGEMQVLNVKYISRYINEADNEKERRRIVEHIFGTCRSVDPMNAMH